MSSFRWIAVALSMILGLGVTRLLSALVAVFRSRAHSRLDWVPLAWAGCIFIWQLQFWWAIIELSSLVKGWTIGYFLTLVFLTLLLFVSAALVLPSSELKADEDLATSFERDGRWSLLALAAYFLLAAIADWLFWNVSAVSREGGYLMGLILLPLIYLRARSRRLQVAITASFILLSVWAAWSLSPASYA